MKSSFCIDLQRFMLIPTKFPLSQEPLPHMFEWIEMEIAKNREEYGLIKTDLPKQKIEDKKS